MPGEPPHSQVSYRGLINKTAAPRVLFLFFLSSILWFCSSPLSSPLPFSPQVRCHLTFTTDPPGSSIKFPVLQLPKSKHYQEGQHRRWLFIVNAELPVQEGWGQLWVSLHCHSALNCRGQSLVQGYHRGLYFWRWLNKKSPSEVII